MDKKNLYRIEYIDRYTDGGLSLDVRAYSEEQALLIFYKKVPRNLVYRVIGVYLLENGSWEDGEQISMFD